MSYDFWQSTSHELASMPRPGAIDHRVIIAYRAANVILNGLNYFWFSQIISAAFSKDRSTRRKVE